MKTYAYCLEGQEITKKAKVLPDVPPDAHIRIKGAISGICGSDVAVFFGKESYLGDEMWGHEGLGMVVQVGKKVEKIKIGDFVATYMHPTFWKVYDIPVDHAVKVPSLDPKYVLQPIACPLNALLDYGDLANKSVLIIGSGFMAYLFTKYLDIFKVSYDCFARHNLEHFSTIKTLGHFYDIVIMASTNDHYAFALEAVKPGGTLIHYATPRFEHRTNFFNWNWKSIKVLFPSPRGANYTRAFRDSLGYVDKLDYEKFLKGWQSHEMSAAFEAEKTKKGIVKNFIWL